MAALVVADAAAVVSTRGEGGAFKSAVAVSEGPDSREAEEAAEATEEASSRAAGAVKAAGGSASEGASGRTSRAAGAAKTPGGSSSKGAAGRTPRAAEAPGDVVAKSRPGERGGCFRDNNSKTGVVVNAVVSWVNSSSSSEEDSSIGTGALQAGDTKGREVCQRVRERVGVEEDLDQACLAVVLRVARFGLLAMLESREAKQVEAGRVV